MARRSIRTLDDIAGISPRLIVECECGRTGTYDSRQILAYFRSRLWSTILVQAAPKFRCLGSADRGSIDRFPDLRGCGAAGHVTLRPAPPPPRPTPPSPIVDERAIKAEVRRRRG